jgi:Fic family protein
MTEQHSRPQQREDVAAVDALYRPFPGFSTWPRLGMVQRDLWARFSTELNDQKGRATDDQLARAVTVAMRVAAIDTGAIEGLYQVDRGFTMSVALQTLAWEHSLGERGEGVRELFEAQLAGYELAINPITGQAPLSEAWLRSLHEQICAAQPKHRVLTEMGWQEQAFQKGRYKEFPNHVRLADGSYHAYAPVADVAPEMRRFFEQVRTSAFEEAHPVEQAAFAHYSLAVIHPFADGNGRVARALASVYLYRSLSIPLVVFADQRLEYLDALARADLGEYAPWLGFVADRGIDTMQLVSESLRSAAAPQPTEVAERLGSHFSPRGRSHAELDNLALRILTEAQVHWEQAVDAVRSRLRSAQVSRAVSNDLAPVGYRRIAGSQAPRVTISVGTPLPAAFDVSLSFRVNIALDAANPFGFQLQVLGSQDSMDIRDTDVTPEVSQSLKFRLDTWVQLHLGTLLAQLEEKATEALREYR